MNVNAVSTGDTVFVRFRAKHSGGERSRTLNVRATSDNGFTGTDPMDPPGMTGKPRYQVEEKTYAGEVQTVFQRVIPGHDNATLGTVTEIDILETRI